MLNKAIDADDHNDDDDDDSGAMAANHGIGGGFDLTHHGAESQ